LNEALRSRLFEMKALDERTRARLAETGELFAGYALAMEDVHGRNADALARRRARQAGEGPPADHAQREREALLWVKRVGWL
jgi:hypothetical protein